MTPRVTFIYSSLAAGCSPLSKIARPSRVAKGLAALGRASRQGHTKAFRSSASVAILLSYVFSFHSYLQAQTPSPTDAGTYADSRNPLSSSPDGGSGQVWSIDPISGALQIRIALETLPVGGRGPSIPFLFQYNSNSTIVLSEPVPTYVEAVSGLTPATVLNFSWSTPGGVYNPQRRLPAGPWTTTFGPTISPTLTSFQPPVPYDGQSPSTCYAEGPFYYVDSGGTVHDLNLAGTILYSPGTNGGGDCVGAVPNTTSGHTSDGSVISADLTGFVPAGPYGYSAGSLGTLSSIREADGTAILNELNAVHYPVVSQVEDTNGNVAKPTSGASWTDSAGRPVANSPFALGSQDLQAGTYTLTTNGPHGTTQPYTVIVASVAPSPNFTLPHPTTSEISVSLSTGQSNGGYTIGYGGVRPFDTISSIQRPDSTSYTFSYEPVYGMVSKVLLPEGGYVRFTWGVRSIGRRTSTSSLVISKESTIVVTDVYMSDGVHNEQAWHYLYDDMVAATGALVSTINGPDGFQEVVTGLPFPQSDLFYDSAGPYKETSRLIRSAGQLKQSISTTYVNNAYGAMPERVATTYWDGSQSVQKQTYLQYDQYENVIERDDSDYYPCSTVVPCTGTTPWLRKTMSTYSWASMPDHLSAHILNKLYDVNVTDGQGSLQSKTTFRYDQAALGGNEGILNHDDTNYRAGRVTGRGNLTTESHCAVIDAGTCSSWLQTLYTYDLAGQLLSKTDPKGGVISYEYVDHYGSDGPAGPTNAYLTKVTSPLVNLPIVDNYTYDYFSGKTTSHVDPNNQTTIYSYRDASRNEDPLGRLLQVQDAVGSAAERWTTYDYSVLNKVTIKADQVSKGDGMLQSSTTWDGFHRPVQQTTPGGVLTDTSYDAFGRVASISNPHFTESSATDGAVTFAYDALGRKTLQCQPDNQSGSGCSPGASYLQWSYAGNTVTFKDEGGSRWQRMSDALGRLTQTTELGTASSPATLQTMYDYDTLGNLKSVDQHGTGAELHRLRSFSYDPLSRLLTATNPETGTICYGTWLNGNCSSGYDPNGNLHVKTDARGMTTSFNYDALSRLTGKQYFDGTPSSCYRYDVSSGGIGTTNPVGKITAEWTQSGSCPTSIGDIPSAAISWKKVATYDPKGRVTAELQCPFAPCPAPTPIQYSYNLAGSLTSATNGLPTLDPHGIGFSYDYDTANRLKSAVSSWDDATHPRTLFKADADVGNSPYGPFGLMAAQLAIPSSSQIPALLQTRAYDNRGRIVTMSTLGAGTAAQPSAVSLSMTPLLVSQGVSPRWVSNCDSRCGTGGGDILVDGGRQGGFTYVPGGGAGGVLPPYGEGPHTLQIVYLGDSSHPAQSSRLLAFSVIPNQLPTPNFTVTVNPKPVPLGQSADIQVAGPCGTQCSGADIFIDGSYAGGLVFDDTGTAGNGTPSTLSVAHHTLTIHYFGDAIYSDTDVNTPGFDVVDRALPNPQISVDIEPKPILADEFGVATLTFPCGSSCRGGHYFVDGNYAGGFVPDSTGTAVVGIARDLFVGQHQFTVDYPGDASYAPVTPSLNFEVTEDHLPVPVVTAVPLPSPIPANQQNPLDITVTASVPNCGGTGHLFVDGAYSGFFFPDANGDAPTSTIPMSAGTHNLLVDYYGSAICKPKQITIPIQAQ